LLNDGDKVVLGIISFALKCSMRLIGNSSSKSIDARARRIDRIIDEQSFFSELKREAGRAAEESGRFVF